MLSFNKQLLFFSTTKKILLVMFFGLALSSGVVFFLNNFYIDSLKQRINSFSLGVGTTRIEQLKSDSLTDAQAPIDLVKNKLDRLKKVYSDTRFVYLMEKKDDKVIFLADSEPKTSDAYSPRNEEYPDATDALKDFFTNKQTFVEGPVSDEYGTWYSAIAPVYDSDGRFVAAIGMDVPAMKYMSTILGIGALPFLFAATLSTIIFFYDSSRKRRIEALRFQVELLGIASHEIRSPLTGLRWGEEILLRDNPSEMQKKMLDNMHDSTLRLQDSIEDILQLASMGAGKASTTVSMEVIDLAALIQDTVEAQKLAAQQHSIQFVYDKSWQPLSIRGDAVKLRRVLNNLISNAVKYANPDSTIEFSSERTEGQCTVAIKNYGIGVPEKDLDHIFDGFYRAGNAIKTAVSGTGMGLFMSRSIIDQHGGRLWIESVENESTTVFLRLPLNIDKPPSKSESGNLHP